jgi:hypothetical protein
MAAVHIVLLGAAWKYPQYRQPLSAACAHGVMDEEMRIIARTIFNFIAVGPLKYERVSQGVNRT